jgi:hypothetical protein
MHNLRIREVRFHHWMTNASLCFLMVICQKFVAQSRKDSIATELAKLNGNWSGIMEYTDEGDDSTVYAMPCQCNSTYNGKSWEYVLEYDEGKGNTFSGVGECKINDAGSAMIYNGVNWDIKKFEINNDTTIIEMETEAKEKRKKVIYRKSIEITAGTFTIKELVGHNDNKGLFVVRSSHKLRRMRNRN